ncbi:hypothetical protein [Phenylobacterium sp.]|uniref:hypothetical protein n=1 Tax=Phenylobacterium sp. TaxID=1871053 RepID=UPI001204ADE5|nr:hypothetical protein [Phenylobacterium sp.]THD70404.1 MAG: hypothetical protein E8A12_03115 [Phenylobacterium sp.]
MASLRLDLAVLGVDLHVQRLAAAGLVRQAGVAQELGPQHLIGRRQRRQRLRESSAGERAGDKA